MKVNISKLLTGFGAITSMVCATLAIVCFSVPYISALISMAFALLHMFFFAFAIIAFTVSLICKQMLSKERKLYGWTFSGLLATTLAVGVSFLYSFVDVLSHY